MLRSVAQSTTMHFANTNKVVLTAETLSVLHLNLPDLAAGICKSVNSWKTTTNDGRSEAPCCANDSVAFSRPFICSVNYLSFIFMIFKYFKAFPRLKLYLKSPVAGACRLLVKDSGM